MIPYLCLAAALTTAIFSGCGGTGDGAGESSSSSKPADRSAAVASIQSELLSWLDHHPEVATAIKWQHKPGDIRNATPVPTVPWAPAAPRDADLLAWPEWSPEQRRDLIEAYEEIAAWHASGAKLITMLPGGAGLTDQPVNLHQEVSQDSTGASLEVGAAYMWKLYTAHVAFSLWVEINGQVPWTITSYDAASLRYLVDSSTMGWKLANGNFVLGNPYYSYDLRADNLPATAFADPRWVYRFMTDAGMVQQTRLESVAKLLEWMRDNMRHMLGESSFGRCEEIWQYRGYPPFSKVISGTVDTENASDGKQHWTVGCHSSVGFMNTALRTLNIPVQPVEVCGHRLAAFLADKTYITHGDLPYNQEVHEQNMPGLKMMIDEATYKSWFTTDLDNNVSDRSGCEGGARDNINRLLHR